MVWLWVAAGLGSLAAREPFVAAERLQIEGVSAGELLLGELNCVACHAAPRRVRTRLASKQAPSLADAGNRLKPGYVATYLRSPALQLDGTTMPDLLHGLPESERARKAADLAAFLATQRAGSPPPSFVSTEVLVAQGRELYHRVGCVTCHAPQAPAGELWPDLPSEAAGNLDLEQQALPGLRENSAPLGVPRRKYPLAALARWLENPLASRPSGRMPSLRLTPEEAQAIAAYLDSWDDQGELRTGHPGAVAPPAEPEPPLQGDATQGRLLFNELGCAACHAIDGQSARPAKRPVARPWGALSATLSGGCLSASPAIGVPDYRLSPAQRAALAEALREPRALAAEPTPGVRVNLTMARLNCFACHARDQATGPALSRWPYFTFHSEFDLGDEGRIPPHLTGVGSKLRPAWLRETLLTQPVAREKMAVRMPAYGAANVEALVGWLEQADDALPSPKAPKNHLAEAALGRQLVGGGGMSCVSCHQFGSLAPLGVPAMDLTLMRRRLQWPWFHAYLPNPPGLRPGTRMPSFWPEGQSTRKDILNGSTEAQIRAIWVYLQQTAPSLPESARK